jgi:hypothetical protein
MIEYGLPPFRLCLTVTYLSHFNRVPDYPNPNSSRIGYKNYQNRSLRSMLDSVIYRLSFPLDALSRLFSEDTSGELLNFKLAVRFDRAAKMFIEVLILPLLP